MKEVNLDGNNFAEMFVNSAVDAGCRVSSGSTPELIATTTKDKFVLNSVGRDLMNVHVGDCVKIVDLLKQGVTDKNKRFFICKDVSKGEDTASAKLGKGFGFSYSPIHAAILATAKDVVSKQVTMSELVEMGLMLEKENGAFVGLKKVVMKLVPFTLTTDTGVEVDKFPYFEGSELVPMFALTDLKYLDHDPKDVD